MSINNTSTITTTSNKKKTLPLKARLLLAGTRIVMAIAYRSNGTVNRFLLNLADIHTAPSKTPVNGVTTSDHEVIKSRRLWFRLFVPLHKQTDSLPVIIYFHGGGFVHFSPSTTPIDTLCRRIARDSRSVVISVNYRLAPEHKCPAQYDDGFDVVKFVDGEIRERVKEFPVCADLQRCFLAGDSAGGNISHHVAVKCAGYDFKKVKLQGLAMIQPGFGGERRTDSESRLGKGGYLTLANTDFFWKAFLPKGSNRDHPAVNVFGSNSSNEDNISNIQYPKTLVIMGGLDLLQDWQRQFVNGLRRSGKEVELVEYSDMIHGFYGTTKFDEYDMLIAKVGEFVHKH